MTLGTPLSEDGSPRRETRSSLFRQVSQEALSEAAVVAAAAAARGNRHVVTRGNTMSTSKSSGSGGVNRTTTALSHKCHNLRSDGRGSPARCVSDFDRVTGTTTATTTPPPLPSTGTTATTTIAGSIPTGTTTTTHSVEDANSESGRGDDSMVSTLSFRTPLEQPALWQHHVYSIRLEAELHPFRLIVARLMSNSTLNRRGLFNVPVDPVALNLPDYLGVVDTPMDLGTVRTKLHSMQYASHQEVADDIRLVFTNAMTYNPQTNPVHVAAKESLAYFEEQLLAFFPPALVLGAQGASAVAAATTTTAVASAVSTPPHAPTPCGGSFSQTTRNAAKMAGGVAHVETDNKRTKRYKKSTHACQSCLGQTCSMCLQGCLYLEPTLLICSGPQCCGARIRKGSVYYITPDGSRQYCDRCHMSLPSVLPSSVADTTCRYKRSLLKRKNEEEIVEDWITCKVCHASMHKICAMFNEYADKEDDFVCGSCTSGNEKASPLRKRTVTFAGEEVYSYVSGATDPVPLSQLAHGPTARRGGLLTSDLLPESCVSSFIQTKVQDILRTEEFPNADRTITVRVISDNDRHFRVPDVVRNHFRMTAGSDIDDMSQRPPSSVHYRSKAIALFQKIDGVDVCIFCMYVHEYDGNDTFDQENRAKPCADSKRVYIAYLDSVEHFRPRPLRTAVYHEILVSYLATAKLRGYESAHIWACPPSRGNSFVFWTYPGSQRTPTQDRLKSWYHEALLRAVDKGVLTDIKSLYESDFEPFAAEDTEDGCGVKCESVCPPLFDGDFWVEEAMRLHALNMTRQLRSRTADGRIVLTVAEKPEDSDGRCPALEVAALLRDKVIANPVALFFRKPVNAAALNLKDYHKIVSRPMDLGTMYAKCMMGEYSTLRDFVNDVELVVGNAKKFNPVGHIVHTQAGELQALFLHHLNEAVKSWPLDDVLADDWSAAQDVSLRLDARLSPDSASEVSVVSGSSQSLVPEKGSIFSVSKMLSGGAPAVEQRMAGKDTWLLEKKSTTTPGKSSSSHKKGASRRRKSCNSLPSEPPAKRRRQTWLAEEVCASVRRMRMALFSCNLKQQGPSSPEVEAKELEFSEYARSFNADLDDTVALDSTLADARHALLEFSQFRNLQFDTLRRAKYSTAVLLYHLHKPDAPGITPFCSGCGKPVCDVRWHKVGKVVEKKRAVFPAHLQKKFEHSRFIPEEVCSTCLAARSDQSDFIPVPVTCQ